MAYICNLFHSRFFNIVFAWLGVICFLIPLIMAIFGGGKGYCNNYCGRGQLFLQMGNTLGWSRKKVAPRWLSSKWFRHGFLLFFMFFFIQMIILTIMVAKGTENLRQTIHLLWTFNVPWHWAYPVEIEPWKAQFAFGLYGIMLTSLSTTSSPPNLFFLSKNCNTVSCKN